MKDKLETNGADSRDSSSMLGIAVGAVAIGALAIGHLPIEIIFSFTMNANNGLDAGGPRLYHHKLI